MKTNRRGFFATIAAAIAAPVMARFMPKPEPQKYMTGSMGNSGFDWYPGPITLRKPMRYAYRPGQELQFHKDAFVLETPRLTDEQITPYFEGMREQWERSADEFDRWTAQQYSEIVEQAERHTDSMVRKSYVRIEG